MYPEFVKKNCNLLGLSIDSNPSHLDWTYDIYKNTGIHVPFPVIADRDMQIAKKYNMISPKASATETVRCVFYIDPNQIIRAILTYPLTNGRNVGEILRLLDGLQITDKEKVVTPANWFPGQPVITPAPKDYKGLLERTKDSINYTCYDWFLCYKQAPIMPFPNNYVYDKNIDMMPTDEEFEIDNNKMC